MGAINKTTNSGVNATLIVDVLTSSSANIQSILKLKLERPEIIDA